jgi:outer membrane receptor for ferrienterochelin and colicin/copper chaperone CopZ
MKYLIISILLLTFSITGITQSITDSSVTIKVFGNCIQCKTRIEAAMKTKGVKTAVWSIESKLLKLQYDPSVITIEKIHQKIADVGHDTELKKAKDKTYNNLPECCLYRENETTSTNIDSVLNLSSTSNTVVKGIVLEEDKKGNFKPLVAASVVWLPSHKGTVTNENGVFNIQREELSHQLVISYTGFQSDTLSVTDQSLVRIILANNRQLKDVTVTARQRSMFASTVSPVKTIVFGEKELLKAACCNLSESFETNPSVDVSYSDAISGSKQIQLLGLSGIYTQLTVENMPGPRGIATATGLSFIPGTWIESIQLTKGTGSVANGYESIAGQINIEEKKPEKSEKLYANLYVNEFGKTDMNVNVTQKLNNQWSTSLLMHYDFLNNKSMDENNDGYRDIPYGSLFTFLNRWKFDDGKGVMAQFGIKLLTDNKTGGELNFNPSTDKFTTQHYGLGLQTERYEAFGKIGYIFPGKKYKSVGLQLAGFSHNQYDYFGLTKYNAQQQNFYSNLIYQSIIGTTSHKFRTGLSFLYDSYNEDLNANNYNRKEIVPGAFFEYTVTPNDKFTMVAGLRADNNNLFGAFLTPRLNLRYQITSSTTIRISGGRGQRTANLLAENTGILASSRSIQMPSLHINNQYGFNPEIAWNEGISIDQKFKMFTRDATLSIDYFRTDFQNQVLNDIDQSARTVSFYNLKGASFSNSFQIELNAEPIKKLDVRMAYRLFDVQTNYHGELLQRPLVARDRAFINIAYETKSKWKFDYTVQWTGQKRLPFTGDNPTAFQLPDFSPSYFLMNAQITKAVKSVDLYVGAENIGNYRQQNLIIDGANPFGKYFDASLIWGPAFGRMIYGGLRFKLK